MKKVVKPLSIVIFIFGILSLIPLFGVAVSFMTVLIYNLNPDEDKKHDKLARSGLIMAIVFLFLNLILFSGRVGDRII